MRGPISLSRRKFGDSGRDRLARIGIPPVELRRRARLSVGGALAVEGGESRVWAVRDKTDPDKIDSGADPAEVIARFG